MTLPIGNAALLSSLQPSSLQQPALQQMRQLAHQAAGAVQASGETGSSGFAGELRASLDRVNQLQQVSSQQQTAFQSGDPRVALNDVMVDKQKASVAFEMTVQLRNRLVTAYKDVMNMPV
ncbi:flagellar hook-basal body complex protein FliE [Pistricoccus aurantiacus]|uniref:Flagellar hook-basal body complex protein FliE n=1 Tax=Pistricoccus aurantiacus TaxID=1883414 RepID=A0A5B8SUJ6_9GAMM|nr:flagellar hook-basal body complex protein FliE [Pistricoccus aurantiacus]QEA39707.1 flagellar hook-basal body complex protein FliE [Pistricoccus aurantiacus]